MSDRYNNNNNTHFICSGAIKLDSIYLKLRKNTVTLINASMIRVQTMQDILLLMDNN